eukprot:3534614-Amphidinium_carterae.1
MTNWHKPRYETGNFHKNPGSLNIKRQTPTCASHWNETLIDGNDNADHKHNLIAYSTAFLKWPDNKDRHTVMQIATCHLPL